MSLVDLEKNNFVLFLKEWLILEEICFLDTAFCNKCQRSRFLSFISAKAYSIPGLRTIPVMMSEYSVWLKARSIHVDQVSFHNRFFRHLKGTLKFDKLVQLSFSRCWDENRDNLVKILTKSYNLINISLAGSKTITDSVIKILASTCTQLVHVSFINLILITKASLVQLFTGNLNIKFVNISGCISVGDEAIVCLANNCRNLTSLSVSSCRQISNVSIRELLKCQLNLKELDISGCTLVSAMSLANLLEISTRLTFLNIDQESIGTEVITTTLATKCQRLKSFHIRGSITSIHSLRQLGLGCRNLQELYLSYEKQPFPNVEESYKLTSAIVESMHNLRHVELVFSTRTTWDNALNRSVGLLHIIEGTFLQFSKIDIRGGNLIASRHIPATTTTTNIAAPLPTDVQEIALFVDIGTKKAIDWLNQMLWSSADTLLSFSCDTQLVVVRNYAVSESPQQLLLMTQCTQLTALHCSVNEHALVVNLQSIVADECRNLVDLDMSYHIYDEFVPQIKRILTNNPKLTKLNVQQCQSVDDSCMYVLAKHCRKMRDLNISNTTVSDSGVGRIALCCKALQHLVVNNCTNITYKSLEKVIQSCLLLETIGAVDVALPMTFKQLLQCKYNC